MRRFFLYLIPFCIFASIGLINTSWIFPSLVIWCCLSLSLVALSYSFNWALLFRKKTNGTIPFFIRLFFIPYLTFVHFYNLAKRARDPAPLFQEIIPNLYVGARLNAADIEDLNHKEIKCVLDLTAEFDGLGIYAQDHEIEYLNVPILDHAIPKRAQLTKTCRWIHKKRLQGKTVLVHCAMGRGRSVLIVAAYLLATGEAQTIEQAMEKITKVRSTAYLNHRQYMILEDLIKEGCTIVKTKLAIIANPVAGGGKWQEHKDEILTTLGTYFQLDVYETSQDREAKDIAREIIHKQGYHSIIACGGDGTINEVASVVANTDKTLGIIPFGTANSLAQVLVGFQSKITPITSACGVIIYGNIQRIDMAQCNDEKMILAVGIGLEAKMVSRASRELKNAMGQLAYIQGFIEALSDDDIKTLTVRFDDEPPVTLQTSSLVVANAAPAWSILAQGRGNPKFADGKLDVTWLEFSPGTNHSIQSIGNLVLNAINNEESPSPDIRHRHVQKITITADEEISYVIDGECRKAHTISITTIPNALRVYCINSDSEAEFTDQYRLAEYFYSD